MSNQDDGTPPHLQVALDALEGPTPAQPTLDERMTIVEQRLRDLEQALTKPQTRRRGKKLS